MKYYNYSYDKIWMCCWQGRELQTEGRVQITSREGVSCLTISTITADDSGKYVVSVENSHGADCHFASVAVEGEFISSSFLFGCHLYSLGNHILR